MTVDSSSMPAEAKALLSRPRRVLNGALVALALVLVAGLALLAYAMSRPVIAPGLSRLAVFALALPLHLLAPALAALLLGLLARRLRARLAALAFGGAAALALALAAWPSLALWHYAGQQGVALSLGEYWANAGRLNRPAGAPPRSLTYATLADGTRLQLDVWPAANTASQSGPAIVRIHGGGWMEGSRGQLPEWNRWLSEQGYRVFDIDYRLAPPERWLDAVGDVKCAIGWVAAHAEEFGVDPTRISLLGESAGGHLSMLAAYGMGDARLPPSCPAATVPIRSVVNFYGPSSLALDYQALPEVLQRLLQGYIGGSPERFGERYRLVSPITHIDRGTPPTLTLHGTLDRIAPVRQARVLDQALAQAGVRHETYLLPASDHVFDLNWGGFATQFARAKVAGFLRR
ncbi:alpha/beta hydrolase fold protein [compost metagenome]